MPFGRSIASSGFSMLTRALLLVLARSPVRMSFLQQAPHLLSKGPPEVFEATSAFRRCSIVRTPGLRWEEVHLRGEILAHAVRCG